MAGSPQWQWAKAQKQLSQQWLVRTEESGQPQTMGNAKAAPGGLPGGSSLTSQARTSAWGLGTGCFPRPVYKAPPAVRRSRLLLPDPHQVLGTGLPGGSALCPFRMPPACADGRGSRGWTVAPCPDPH